MNKDKALERLTALEAEIVELRKIIAAPDDGIWMLEDGDECYILDRDGEIFRTDYGKDFFKNMHSQGNLFRTLEAAERERDRRALEQELKQRANFKPDWKDTRQSKYYLRYNHNSQSFIWDSSAIYENPNTVYFRDKDESLIEEYGDRLKLLFEGVE